MARTVVETFAPDGGLVVVEARDIDPIEAVRKYVRGCSDDRYVIFDIESLRKQFPRRWRKIVEIVKDEAWLDYSYVKVLLVTTQNKSVLLVEYDSPCVTHVGADEEGLEEPIEPVEEIADALRKAGIPTRIEKIWVDRGLYGLGPITFHRYWPRR